MEGQARQQIGEYFFEVVKGDLIIILSDQLHSTYSIDEKECVILVLQFCPEYFMLSSSTHTYKKSYLAFNDMLFSKPFITEKGFGKQLLVLIKEIEHELKHKYTSYELMIKSKIYHLACMLIRYYENMPENQKQKGQIPEKPKIMLERTFSLIDNKFSEKLSLEDAAKASNLSITHFSRLFKKTTGMSFKQYLNYYRVKRAEILLTSGKSITQIAYDCGFGSMSSFIRNFKKFKNCTPSSYICNTSNDNKEIK